MNEYSDCIYNLFGSSGNRVGRSDLDARYRTLPNASGLSARVAGEGTNGKIQLIEANARGYSNLANTASPPPFLGRAIYLEVTAARVVLFNISLHEDSCHA